VKLKGPESETVDALTKTRRKKKEIKRETRERIKIVGKGQRYA